MESVEIVSQLEHELVPQKELSNYAKAVTELAESTEKLDGLAEQAKQYAVIGSKEDFTKAATILSEVRSMKKQGEFKIGPFVDMLNTAVKHVRQYRNDYEAKVKSIDDSLNAQLADWNRREAEAAQKEEDEKNAKLRKEAADRAAEQKRLADKQAEEDRKKKQKEIDAQARAGEIKKREAADLKKKADEEAARTKQANAQQAQVTAADVHEVRVLPDVPKVSGLRKQTYWHWKLSDITKVPREMLYPTKRDDGTYDTAKFPSITQMVSKTKDKRKAESACPGIVVWSDDRV